MEVTVVDEQARLELYESAKEAFGVSSARTLMDSLPPSGWGDVVSKRDLDQALELLEARLDAKMLERISTLQRNLFFGMLASQAAFAGLVVALLN